MEIVRVRGMRERERNNANDKQTPLFPVLTSLLSSQSRVINNLLDPIDQQA